MALEPLDGSGLVFGLAVVPGLLCSEHDPEPGPRSFRYLLLPVRSRERLVSMTTATVDLRELVAGMAGGRGQRRSEADLQAQVRDLLLYRGLSLADAQFVLLESPVTGQHRIDIEVGCVAIECKRDLRTGNIFEGFNPSWALG